MDRCKTCKYWNADQVEQEVDGVGKCHRIKMLFDCVEWNEDCTERVIVESAKDDKAFVVDGSDYLAELMTMPDFGCIHHEFKVDY